MNLICFAATQRQNLVGCTWRGVAWQWHLMADNAYKLQRKQMRVCFRFCVLFHFIFAFASSESIILINYANEFIQQIHFVICIMFGHFSVNFCTATYPIIASMIHDSWLQINCKCLAENWKRGNDCQNHSQYRIASSQERRGSSTSHCQHFFRHFIFYLFFGIHVWWIHFAW